MIKILVIRLSSMGDIIHTFPMVKDIKNNIANCSIDWLVDENFKEILKYNTNIDNVVSIPLRNWKKSKLKFIFKFIKWKKSLTNIKYDYIIDSQGLLKSAILSKCFKGNVYGYSIKSVREKLACIFYKRRIDILDVPLVTIKNRLLSKNIFNYTIVNSNIDFGIAENLKFEFKSFFEFNYIILFHATSKKDKKYPVNNWIEIIKFILSNYDYKIILPYGSSVEFIESNNLKNYFNSDNVIVHEKIYNFSELYNLIYNSSFVIGVDTGLIHLSNALNKKMIGIYTNTDPNKTGIIESNIAKNLGNINMIPDSSEVIELFNNILKI
ncbi:MAG: lipopolysaccharide heptosyltransferase I [Burkholderiales bacterium]|nr:lipopolysaccharide heptosyltransferase I [Burkholderiales bacterium]